MTENFPSETNFEITLKDDALSYLRESAKWCFFLSIMGFIGVAIMLLLGVFMGTAMSAMSDIPGLPPGMGGMLSAVYIVMAVLYFFPVYYLFKFSTDMKQGIVVRDGNIITSALQNLKSHYKFLGIATIVFIIIYILIIIGVAIFAASFAM